LDLPVSKVFKKKAIDIVSQKDLRAGCTVNNTFGDYGQSSYKRRSQMTLILNQDKASKLKNRWLVFKVKVLNPDKTPVTEPEAKYMANTFQVVLRGQGDVLGTASRLAPRILSVWKCKYTEWMFTAPCTAACGGGVRYSVRRLMHPPPENYPVELLENCRGKLSEQHDCNMDPCNVDCKLGDWTPFSDGPCSATCGKGFQVQRRRIVEGPIGGGKLCPKHDHPSRVRYWSCEAAEDCIPRCDIEPGIGDKSYLYGACSQPCSSNVKSNNQGGNSTSQGLRDAVPIIVRKERKAVDEEKCGAGVHKEQCGVECDQINFFPSGQGRLPRMGKWTEMVLVFFLSNLAESLVLEAPPGFDIGRKVVTIEKGPAGKEVVDLCLLKEHNIPRLGRCRVVTDASGRVSLNFDLMNALEPNFISRDGGQWRPQYEVHFYTKPPSICQQGFVNEVCKDFMRAQWRLKSESDDGDSDTEGELRANFDVYSLKAKEWRTPKHMVLAPDAGEEFIENVIPNMKDLYDSSNLVTDRKTS
jgi:hypothetical protein